MNARQYEQGLLTLAMFQLSQSDSVDEMIAIGSSLRNRVRHYNLTYSEVIEDAYQDSPLREFPSISDPILIEPGTGLLAKVEKIYDFTMPDITSSHLQPEGAMFFAKVTTLDPESKFSKTILARQDIHVLCGSWGAQNFYT